MRPHLWALLVLVVAPLAAAQTTTVHFLSETPVGVFKVGRLTVEDSAKLSSGLDAVSSELTLLGTAPFSLSLPDGDYLLNVGGTEEYNRLFSLRAEGGALDVRIRGDLEKAKRYGYVTLATGFLFALSFEAMARLVDLVPESYRYAPLALPIAAAAGFGLSCSVWIGQMPRVEVRPGQ